MDDGVGAFETEDLHDLGLIGEVGHAGRNALRAGVSPDHSDDLVLTRQHLAQPAAQQTARAAFPPGDAREDWTILRALSPLMGEALPYDTLQALRAAMYKTAPALAALDRVVPATGDVIDVLASGKGALKDEPFRAAVTDFYLTNPIARASAVMAEMSALKKAAAAKKTSLSAAE